jgi:Spy/CpxP family protein refolding chaperone
MKRSVCTLAAALVFILGFGCGQNQNPLSTESSSDFDTAAREIATVEGNAMDAEMLTLSDDIEALSTSDDDDGGISTSDDDDDDSDGSWRWKHPLRWGRLKKALDLTDDQVEQIKEILMSAREQVIAVREQVRSDSLTCEEGLAQLQTIRESAREQILAVLTAEQREKFGELRRHHGWQFNLEKLAHFLHLTEEQTAQIDSLMRAHWAQMHAIRDQVFLGCLSRREAREQIKALYESERDFLASILDEKQLRKFRRLLHHPRFGFGPRGYGCGPHGDFHRPGED